MRIDDLLAALPTTETDTIIFCDIRDINHIVNELDGMIDKTTVRAQWKDLTRHHVRHVMVVWKGKTIYLINNADLSEFIRLGGKCTE